MPASKLSAYHMVSGPVLDGRAAIRSRVVFAARSAEAFVIDEAGWQAVVRGELDTVDPRVLAELTALELIVPEDEDEVAVLQARARTATDHGDDFYLVVQPTAACQLGCGYCGQEHRADRLGPDDQDRLVARVRQRLSERPYRTMTVAWFGAEPLLALDVIRQLTPRLRAAATEAGAHYRAKMATNAVALTGEVAEELVDRLGVGFIELTLDGPAEWHDRRRHWKGGTESFERIFTNLLDVAALDLDLRLSVRCNVDRSNVDGVLPLLRVLADAGLAGRVSFQAATVHSWGNDAHLDALPMEEFAARETEWLIEQERLGFGPALLPGLRPVVCMAVQPQAEVVDAYGQLFNCTEVPYVPTYGEDAGYRTGSLADAVERRADGRTHLRVMTEPAGAHRLATFADRIADRSVPCAGCAMLPVCGGSCPKQWIEGRVPCPSTKYNIADRLRLVHAATQRQH